MNIILCSLLILILEKMFPSGGIHTQNESSISHVGRNIGGEAETGPMPNINIQCFAARSCLAILGKSWHSPGRPYMDVNNKDSSDLLASLLVLAI